jgi:hypothetical protein
MTCDLCRDIVERQDVPHVVRACLGCGREMHILQLGEHGRGIKVEKGDRFVIPADWLRVAANPLKSVGMFTRSGLRWFAEQIFVEGLMGMRDDFPAELARLEAQADKVLQGSTMLSGLDINNPDDSEKIFDVIKENKGSPEWWALWLGIFLSVSNEAIANKEPDRATWALACAERCRAMLAFLDHLEEVVWMGHSAKRIIDILKVWDANKQNSDEQFWQLTFNENAYVLSQVFAVPMVFIQDKAYVGGTKLDRTEGRFVDYLFSMESSAQAVLIETKAPTTRLLGSQYRVATYPPSHDLSGAVTQVLQYREELVANLSSITRDQQVHLATFSPRCVILVGNGDAELKDIHARASFETFRSALKVVEIVTYDELFRKVEVLANLFNLVKGTS